MRIKEEIKRSGFFWLPSLPQRQIPGTLTISDGGNIELELAQPLVNDIRAFKLDGFNQILGRVEKNGPVTLDNCFRIAYERSIVDGALMGPEVVRANRVFIGIQCGEDISPRFNAVSLSVEGIDKWVGISGIEVDRHSEKRALTISYNEPEDIPLSLENGMKLLITFDSTFPGFPITNRAAVGQQTYFSLISKNARELNEFTSVASKVTAFLCFVMNEIVCLDRISATSNNLRRDIGNGRIAPIPVGIYCPSWPYSKNEPRISELDILFTFKEIQSRAASIINKWIENYEQIAPALDLYFWAQTAVLPSWNMQFLTLVQGLEAFHSRTSNEKHMDEDEFEKIRKTLVNMCPKRERSWFAQKLNYANELTLRNRIEKLIEPFDCLIDDERRPKLIDRIVNTRNYLTHYDSKLESKVAKGDVLRFLCIKMNALFRLHFLKLIGFHEQEINAIVDKCPSLKEECNL